MKSLKITKKDKKALSKSQMTFNRLTKRIGTLTHKITKEKDKLKVVYQEYATQVVPLEQEAASCSMDMSLLLHKAALKYKYSPKQMETFGTAILFLCAGAFPYRTPNEQEEAMFDHWSENTYQEELEAEMSDMKSMLGDELREQHGLDIDLSDYEETPEWFAKFQQRMQEEVDRKSEQDQSTPNKKTKKQLANELRLKEEETKQLKSIRAIYISLAKVLHPDAHTEGFEREQREELMKKVTEAYQAKDLVSLLKLEMEWVVTESNNLDKLSEDKLTLYVASLKSRIAELEQELDFLYLDPKYHAIEEIIYFSEKNALKEVRDRVESIKSSIAMMNQDYSNLSNQQTKASVLNFASELKEGIALSNRDYEDFDDFDFTDEMLEEFEKIFGKF